MDFIIVSSYFYKFYTKFNCLLFKSPCMLLLKLKKPMLTARTVGIGNKIIVYAIKDSHSNITNIRSILNWKSEIIP